MRRRRLLDALESPLPLIFVEAAPGAGKRTLLEQWAAGDGVKQGPEHRVLIDARRTSADRAGYLRIVVAAIARSEGIDVPVLGGSGEEASAAAFVRGLRSPAAVAVLEADYLSIEVFELLLDVVGRHVRLLLSGFDLAPFVAAARRRHLHFVQLDDSDLECDPAETRELMVETGLAPTSQAVTAMHESTRGHPGLISAAVRSMPVESASGQVSPDRALAAFLAAMPLDAWPSAFARFVVSLVSVPRFSADEAAIIAANDAAPALLHRLRLLGLGTMSWHLGMQARVFHWSEAIRAVMAPFLREVQLPDDALRQRVVAAADRFGDRELAVVTLVEMGELQQAEELLDDWLWDVLPNAGSGLWRAMERLGPQALVGYPGLLCIRLRVDPGVRRAPESVLAANLAGRALSAVRDRSADRRFAPLARALELLRVADERSAVVELALRARELVMQPPATTSTGQVTVGAVSDLLLLADTLLRTGNSMNAAVFAGQARRLIGVDADRLDPSGERRLFAGRVELLDARERGLDDPVDAATLLASLQFLRHDADTVAASLAQMWGDLDAGDPEGAEAKSRAAVASVANVEEWPMLLHVLAWQSALQGRIEETQTIIAGYRPGYPDDKEIESLIPGSSLNASRTFLSQIVGRPVRDPEFIPPPGEEIEELMFPRRVHATALIDALAALRAGRPAVARTQLERAIAVLPRHGLSVFSLTRATEDEVRRLTDLIADHPLADRLNLPAAAAYRRASAQPAVVLSERERQILGRIHDGATNEQIGRALYLSVNTVKFHRVKLMRKLGVRNRAELLEAAKLLRLL